MSLYFKLLWPFCSTEQNGLSNFGRGSPKEYSCIFFFKIHPLVKAEKLFKDFFYF